MLNARHELMVDGFDAAKAQDAIRKAARLGSLRCKSGDGRVGPTLPNVLRIVFHASGSSGPRKRRRSSWPARGEGEGSETAAGADDATARQLRSKNGRYPFAGLHVPCEPDHLGYSQETIGIFVVPTELAGFGELNLDQGKLCRTQIALDWVDESGG